MMVSARGRCPFCISDRRARLLEFAPTARKAVQERGGRICLDGLYLGASSLCASGADLGESMQVETKTRGVNHTDANLKEFGTRLLKVVALTR